MQKLTVQQANGSLTKTHLGWGFRGGTYWSGRNQSKQLGEEAEQAHGMREGTASVRLKLFPGDIGEPLKLCNTAWTKLRTMGEESPAVPWGTRGQGERHKSILAIPYYFGEFIPALAAQKQIADAALSHLVREYPHMVVLSQQALAGMQHTVVYPTVEEVEAKFWMADVQSMTSTIDMATPRNQIVLPMDAAEGLFEDFQAADVETSDVVVGMRSAMKSQQETLITVMNKLADAAEKVQAGESAVITKAMTDTVRGVIQTCRSTNIFDNPKVEKLAGIVEQRIDMFSSKAIRKTVGGAVQAQATALAVVQAAESFDWCE